MANIEVRSEITGSVWKIETSVGSKIAEDDPIAILESMKMEIPVLAPEGGTVKKICVEKGQLVAEGDVILILDSRVTNN